VGISAPTVYAVVKAEGLWPPAGRGGSPRPGKPTVSPEILPEAELVRLLPDAGVLPIIGAQGSGKSALAYRVGDLVRGRRPIVVVGPGDLRQHLPSWALLVQSLEQAPAGSLVICDEAQISLSSRTAMTTANRDFVHLMALLRQKGILLLLLSHHLSDVDTRAAQHASALLIKRPGQLALLDRPILRPVLARAARAFAKAPGDPRRLTYFVSGDRETLIETGLPSYWSDGLSRSYATWTPRQRSQDQEASKREEQSEEDARRQAQAEEEQAKAARLHQQRQERGQQWYHRALDDGLSPPLAAQVWTKALSGWTAERLRKLHSACHALVSRGIGAEGLAAFVASRPDDLIVADLRTLAGALSTFRRWKITEESTAAFLQLFFLAPPEALGVLENLDDEKPTWRSLSLASRITRRLSALQEQARIKAMGEALSQLLAYLRRPRLQQPPPMPAPPPKELVPLTTPAGVVEAHVLSRAGGQVLLRLPTGRLLSLTDDGRGRSPPPRGLSLPPD